MSYIVEDASKTISKLRQLDKQKQFSNQITSRE